MTARDAGGIACRVFAIYLAILGFRGMGVVLASVPVERFGYDSSGITGSPFVVSFLQTCIYIVGAALLWVKAQNFWPSDVSIEGDTNMNARSWLNIALIVMGTYFLMTDGPYALIALLRATLQTNIKWPEFNPVLVAETAIQSIGGISLIVYGVTTWPGRSVVVDTSE